MPVQLVVQARGAEWLQLQIYFPCALRGFSAQRTHEQRQTVTAILRHVETLIASGRESGLLGQMIRFGISGGISTLIYLAVYFPLTIWVWTDRAHAVYAVPPSFVVAVVAGYFLHSQWSFKGHGTREQGVGQKLKFVAVQGSGVALNGLVTWLATAVLDLPAWAPVVPAIGLATIFTYILNRYLVFK
jgi:putative flippase GtrA